MVIIKGFVQLSKNTSIDIVQLKYVYPELNKIRKKLLHTLAFVVRYKDRGKSSNTWTEIVIDRQGRGLNLIEVYRLDRA